MPLYRLPDEHVFPPPEHATASGMLAIGGDLHPDRLLLAYRMGIFPWSSEDQPLWWWSPDPRMVLPVGELRIQRSLKKRVKRGDYRVTFDTCFAEVLQACAETFRPGQDGTWLTPELQQSFIALHQRGLAHSVEVWFEGELVGGLYGLGLGRIFCGESPIRPMVEAGVNIAGLHSDDPA